MVSCIERIRIWSLLNYTVISNVYWKPEIGQGLKPYSQLKYTDSVYPTQLKGMVFPLVYSQYKSDSMVGDGTQDHWKINITYGVF